MTSKYLALLSDAIAIAARGVRPSLLPGPIFPPPPGGSGKQQQLGKTSLSWGVVHSALRVAIWGLQGAANGSSRRICIDWLGMSVRMNSRPAYPVQPKGYLSMSKALFKGLFAVAALAVLFISQARAAERHQVANLRRRRRHRPVPGRTNPAAQACRGRRQDAVRCVH